MLRKSIALSSVRAYHYAHQEDNVVLSKSITCASLKGAAYAQEVTILISC